LKDIASLRNFELMTLLLDVELAFPVVQCGRSEAFPSLFVLQEDTGVLIGLNFQVFKWTVSIELLTFCYHQLGRLTFLILNFLWS
jgi:hypothetical protein